MTMQNMILFPFQVNVVLVHQDNVVLLEINAGVLSVPTVAAPDVTQINETISFVEFIR